MFSLGSLPPRAHVSSACALRLVLILLKLHLAGKRALEVTGIVLLARTTPGLPLAAGF